MHEHVASSLFPLCALTVTVQSGAAKGEWLFGYRQDMDTPPGPDCTLVILGASGDLTPLSYVEVLHANHLDTVNKAFNIDTQIPLDYYFQAALDRMFDHLRNGAALPKSQVLKTAPIGVTGDPMLATKLQKLFSLGA